MPASGPERRVVKAISLFLERASKGRVVRAEEAELLLSHQGASEELFKAAFELRKANLGEEMRFYYPLPRFPSISVTGSRCSLNCRQCSGRYLRQMKAAETPEELKRLLERLVRVGATGCLISGGSNPDGSLPLSDFYEVLRWAKRETDLIVNVHTGLVEMDDARLIAGTGIDIASLDLVGNSDTIRTVIGLNKTPEDYVRSIKYLVAAGVPTVVPHICVGLHWGQIKGEANALSMLSEVKPRLIVILGLRPTKGTPMQSVPAPKAETIARAVAASRLMFPDASIALGCMIPNSDRDVIEGLALKAGADRMVLPSPSTIELARREGLHILRFDACCAVPSNLEGKALRSSLS